MTVDLDALSRALDCAEELPFVRTPTLRAVIAELREKRAALALAETVAVLTSKDREWLRWAIDSAVQHGVNEDTQQILMRLHQMLTDMDSKAGETQDAVAVQLLRIVTKAAELELYVSHLESCPAIGAHGDCNCGLLETETEYRKARKEAGLHAFERVSHDAG